MPTQPEEWCNSRDLANVAGINLSKARRALARAYNGHLWRGHHLVVRQVRGRGGNGGLQYEVRIDSLPADLRPQAQAVAIPELPLEIGADDDGSEAAVARWRYQVIEKALKHPSRSSERAAAIAEAAAEKHTDPLGKRRRVSVSTLRGWILAYERSGMTGLKPQRRGDRGRRRVYVTRRWDGAVPFTDETKSQIADRLAKEIRSLWAANASYGWRWVSRLASDTLQEETLTAGFDPGARQLRWICHLPKNLVEHGRSHRAVAVYDKDRKRYFDTSVPRISRTRAGRRPMEIVIGDVHHLDVLLPRPDGSTFTPKVIAWLDWANNRIFFNVVFLPKGKGVRIEHVVNSYIDMVTHPEWGMPEVLYLDNGGEYNWSDFIDDAQRLTTEVRMLDGDPELMAALHRRRTSVVRAQPYNAPAKSIEGIFGVIESGPLSMLTGWIGGNRMKKKTANLGRAPEPYPHDEDSFRKELASLIEAYETHSQQGALSGRSPRQVFAEQVESGWQRMDASRATLLAAFARNKVRTVNQGSFTLEGVRYTSREIQRLPAKTKVIARVPLVGERDVLPVLTSDHQFLCMASRDVAFDALDPAGAKEAAARRAENRRGIEAMRQEVDQVDLMQRVRRMVDKEDPAPIPESAGLIEWNDTLAEVGRALETTAAEREAQEAEEAEQLIQDRRGRTALIGEHFSRGTKKAESGG